MKKTIRYLGIILLLVMILFTFIILYINYLPLSEEEIIEKRKETLDHSLGQESQVIIVYFPDGLTNGLVLQPIQILVPKSENPELSAVNELIKGVPQLKLNTSFPEGTQVLNIKKEKGIYFVNFNSNFQNLGSSTSPLQDVIASLVYTLTEFPDTEGVQILINNEQPYLLPGGVINKPFTREDVKTWFEVGKLENY